MALVRRLARPLLAAAAISASLDTLRDPKPRVALAEGIGARIARPLGLPEDAETLVKAGARIQFGAGLLLATGRVRRPAAVILLALQVPATIAEHSFWSAQTQEERSRQRTQFLRDLGLIGGLILAAVDTEGRPSLGWRARRAGGKARRSLAETKESVTTQAGELVHDAGERAEGLVHAIGERLPG